MENKKIIIIVITIIIVAVLGGYSVYKYYSGIKPEINLDNNTAPKQESENQTEINPETGWKIYKNSQYGFEFQYPSYDSEFFSMKEPEVLSGSVEMSKDGCFVKNDKYPDAAVVRNKNVLANGIKFCLSLTGDSGKGWSYPTYFYTTEINGKYIVIAMKFNVATCIALKGTPDYDRCQDYFKEPKNPPDIAQEIISTFKFTK